MIAKNRLVGLAGAKGSGKDTMGLMLGAKLGYQKVSFAQPIKQALKQMFGLTDEHFDWPKKEEPIERIGNKTPRYLMQTLGTEWGRNMISESVWVEAALGHADTILSADPEARVVLTDVRFDDEARAIKDRGGVIVEIDRPGVAVDSNHVSEAGVSRDLVELFVRNEEGHQWSAFDQIVNYLSREADG